MSDTDPVERNESLLRRYIEDVWDDGNVEAIDEIFGDTQNMRRKWGDDIDDRAELKAYLGSLIEKYDNDTFEVRTVVASEDEAIVFWEAEMELVDDHLGIKPAGRAASRRGMTYGRIEDGRLARVIDVSDSRELMPRVRRLARSELMTSMHEGVVVVDDENLVVDVNDVALSAFDWERDAALDRPVEEVLHADLTIPDPEEMTEITSPDGRRTFEIRTSVVTDPKDERVGRALVLRDVTARKRYEEQLNVLNRVLRHNLRNDMTAVRAYAEHLREAARSGDVDSATVEEMTGGIVAVADELVELGETARRIESLFDVTPASAEHDLAAVAGQVVDRVRETHPEVTVDLSRPATAPALALKGVSHAIYAAAENGCEHNDAPDPRVEVTVEELEDEPYVRVRVADNGPGMPAHERRIIETGEETDLDHGSGLGLWLVRWMVVRSDGRLRFGRDGPGATVCLDFPTA